MKFKAVPEYISQMQTLRDLLGEAVHRFGDSPSLSLREGVSFSFHDVGRLVRHTQAELVSRKVKPGDRVALLADNRPQWGVSYLAIVSMGAIVVPILPDFSAAEVTAILEHSESVLVIVSESLRRRLDEGTSSTPRVVLEELVDPDATSGESAQGDLAGSEPKPEDLAAIIYTSGTTGQPKGVMLSHANIVQNLISSRSVVEIGPGDRFLSVLPLAHSYECTIGFLVPFASGGSVTYLGRPPALSTLLPALQEVKPTMMLSVPLIMEKVYQSRVKSLFTKNVLMRVISHIGPLRKLIHRIAGRKVYEAFGGALRFYGIGGAPLSPKAERFLREGRFPYSIGYGLTETAPLVAGTDAEHTRYRSTGPAIEGVEVKLDQNTTEGDQGELLVRGPNVMQGYYKNDEATREVLTEDGWFRTGDLASRDRDGYIYIRGRLKNMIVGPSGENIYPGDIETVINEHPMVLESLVFEWQGQLVARVHIDLDRIKEEMDENANDLTATQERADEILGEVKSNVNSRVSKQSRLSRMILQWEPFEMTPTRKIKRFLYTQLGRQEQ